MFPADRIPVAVQVQYTSRGQRVCKTFPNAYAARSFYAAKYKAGADPKVLRCSEPAATQPEPPQEHSTMTQTTQSVVAIPATAISEPTTHAEQITGLMDFASCGPDTQSLADQVSVIICRNKAAVAQKPAKKEKAPKTDKEPVKGFERTQDLPWCDKKVAIFKALKALKATSKPAAKPGAEIAEKAEVSQRDVRHYCYAARAAGLVDLDKQEGISGYVFFLTAKGAAIDPVKALKEQESKKVK